MARPSRGRTRASRSRSRLAVEAFAARAGPRPWRVAWCAGASVVSADQATLDRETMVLGDLLRELGAAIDSRRVGPGAFFFASSAGGMYAGSDGAPFDERTMPRPIAPYGHAKLLQEGMVRSWAAEYGVPSLVGRISNLYGPGQNLSKPQGLVSQLCWSQLLQSPVNIYVPLETRRDYLYAPDCGVMIANGLDELAAGPGRPSAAVLKVMASQRPMSIGAVLGEFRRVTRRRPAVSLRTSALARHQVLDLRLSSHEMRHLDRHASTPFPVGLHATYRDLQHRFALAGRAA